MTKKSYVGLELCFYCGKEKGVLINTNLRNIFPSYGGVVANTEPCDGCKKLMEKGVVLISIEDDTTEEEMGVGGTIPNPRRTGKLAVVKDEFIKKAFDEPNAKWALEHKFAFITDSVWNMLGIPLPK